MSAPQGTVTVLLQNIAHGDPAAAAELLPLVYDELRKLADVWMAKAPPGQTLQPTALVHEAYLRLLGGTPVSWENRGHFFFTAARAMRELLVEQARRKAALRRGGGRKRLDLEHLEVGIAAPPDEILALEDALGHLEREDPDKYQLVLLRFYAGLTMEEIAEVLNRSRATLDREWRYIRARLYAELGEPAPPLREDAGHES